MENKEKLAVHSHGHHSHAHEHEGFMGQAEISAFLAYMAEHNQSHMEELDEVCHALEHQNKPQMASLLREALQYFKSCNNLIAKARELG